MTKNWTLWGQGRGRKEKKRQKAPVKQFLERGWKRDKNPTTLRKMKCTCCIAQRGWKWGITMCQWSWTTSTADVSWYDLWRCTVTVQSRTENSTLCIYVRKPGDTCVPLCNKKGKIKVCITRGKAEIGWKNENWTGILFALAVWKQSAPDQSLVQAELGISLGIKCRVYIQEEI